MLLLIDSGNSRIKWAVVNQKNNDATLSEVGNWQGFGIVLHDEIEQLENHWRAYPIEYALISNVAGPLLSARLEDILKRFPHTICLQHFREERDMAGVYNHYQNPRHTGSDRIASLIGARFLFPGKSLILGTFGTATTVDCLSADGHFLGGMILPGLAMMTRSLADNTALLPHIEQFKPTPIFGDNTSDAVISGCVGAQLGAILYACDQFKLTQGEILCVLSGGAASLISPRLEIKHRIVEHLVLVGMQVAEHMHFRKIPC